MENKENSQETPTIYRGKLFDVVVTNQTQVSQQEIERFINPGYQKHEYQKELHDLMEQYGDALERLRYL